MSTVMQWADTAVKARPFNPRSGKGECLRVEELGVRLIQTGKGRFTVVYGKQVKKDMDYGTAALTFGLCAMHALACDEKLNNA